MHAKARRRVDAHGGPPRGDRSQLGQDYGLFELAMAHLYPSAVSVIARTRGRARIVRYYSYCTSKPKLRYTPKLRPGFGELSHGGFEILH